MSTNRLQLNSDKTEFMWLTTAQSQHQPTTHFRSFDRLYLSFTVCNCTRDLGVFIDQDLTMKTHVQLTASRCFATLRQLRSIRRYIPTPVFQSLVSAPVLSRLDYCNSLLINRINLPLINIQRLQSVQNAAARLVFNLRRCDHITEWCAHQSPLAPRARANYIQGSDADVPCSPRLCTTTLGVFIHMCNFIPSRTVVFAIVSTI